MNDKKLNLGSNKIVQFIKKDKKKAEKYIRDFIHCR